VKLSRLKRQEIHLCFSSKDYYIFELLSWVAYLLGFLLTYIAQTIKEELNEYLEHFFDLGSPMFISLFFVASLLFVIYLFIKGVIIPDKQKHKLEKKELELLSAKKISSLIEFNPEPVLKIDKDYNILFSNEAAYKLISPYEKEGPAGIKKRLLSHNIDVEDIITSNKSFHVQIKITDRIYSIFFRGSQELNEAHVFFHDITDLVKYEKELENSKAKLTELSNHIQDIIESERGRIASGLHDSVGQKLLMSKLVLDKISKQKATEDPIPEIIKVIDEINSTINELKEISYSLKPKYLSEIGLGPALNSLCEKVSAETNIKNIIFIEKPDERYTANIELTIYRIAQEALNNIIKHSSASEFNLQLLQNDNRIKLMISDNGKGFDTDVAIKGKGFGLFNMKQRAENIEGTLKVDSSEEFGTLIVTEIPIS